MERPLLWSQIRVALHLAAGELRQNAFVYLTPLPFFLLVLGWAVLGEGPLVLGTRASLAVLAGAAILAIVQGQQGFAGEADRQTLDFLLSKPISPVMLTAVKYLVNAGLYAVWLALFASFLRFSLPDLPVPGAALASWILFSLLALVGMSFLAGMLSRGAERLLITVLLAAGFAGLCYALSIRLLDLAAARYFWPDIPPHLSTLVCTVFPLVLLVCVMLLPPVFVFWCLRGRPPLSRFRPAWRVILVWGALLLVVEGARATLGPAVWPLSREFLFGGTGDWSPRAGVVLAGPAFGGGVDRLAVARLGGHARVVFRGTRVYSPRWSPDGKSIAFVDDGWIKILHGRSATRLVRGENPYWSADGQSLAYTETAERKRTAGAVRQVFLRTGAARTIWSRPVRPLGLAWDSARQKLYLFEREGILREIDLRARTEKAVPVPTPVRLSVQNPWGVIGQDGRLYLTVTYANRARVFAHRPGSTELSEFDEYAGHLSSVWPALASPAAGGYLWPRIDRAFEFQGFIPAEDDHDHADE